MGTQRTRLAWSLSTKHLPTTQGGRAPILGNSLSTLGKMMGWVVEGCHLKATTNKSPQKDLPIFWSLRERMASYQGKPTSRHRLNLAKMYTHNSSDHAKKERKKETKRRGASFHRVAPKVENIRLVKGSQRKSGQNSIIGS